MRLPNTRCREPRPAWKAARGLLPLAAAMLLGACVVVPQTREVYDAKCRILTKEVVLETAVLGSFTACQDRECGVMLASLGLVTAASAVVSGSVAVVGNVVYWFERQGRCLAAPPAPALPAYPGQAGSPATPDAQGTPAQPSAPASAPATRSDARPAAG